MIMPTKHLLPSDSLLGTGGRVLALLRGPRSTAALWHAVQEQGGIATFDRFVLTLDLLFLMGAIDINGGLIRRVNQ